MQNRRLRSSVNKSDLFKKIFSRISFGSIKNIIIILVVLAVVLLWRFKGYFIVASINGQPVSRWELSDRLVKQFGRQTIETIVNERLILAAARQKGIFISTNDIDTRIKDIEGRLQGNATLDEALQSQGLTMPAFKRQIELQLSIEKLFETESTVSAKEIDDYLVANKSLYQDATDTAKLRQEIEASLKQQKIGEKFDTWLTDLRNNANVKINL